MTPAQEACARLAASRTQLRAALQRPGARTTAPGGDASPGTGWLARLRADPAGSVLMEIAHAWWARHPWRDAGHSVAQIASATLAPLAQRHPLGLVLGAFAVGGLVVWSRPWRRSRRGHARGGGLPGLLLAAVAAVPVATWSSALAALMHNADAAGPGSEPGDAPPSARSTAETEPTGAGAPMNRVRP